MGCKITDPGVQYLRKLKKLRRAEPFGGPDYGCQRGCNRWVSKSFGSSNIYRSQLTNAGLAKLQSLPNLRFLDVRYSGVTNAGIDAFQRARPDCKVTFVSTTGRQCDSTRQRTAPRIDG